MRNLFTVILLLLLSVQDYPKYRVKTIPDPIPSELSDVFELDTLLSGYWTIPIGDKELYPVEVGYITQPDMKHYFNWPSMESVLQRSYEYFRFRYEEAERTSSGVAYYADDKVKVFVKLR